MEREEYGGSVAYAERASETLGQTGKEGASQTELRVTDADPGAVADLVDLIEKVEDIEAQLHPFRKPSIDRLNDAEIDLLVARQGRPIRDRARVYSARIGRPQPTAGDEVGGK